MQRILQKVALSRKESEDLEAQSDSFIQRLAYNKRLEFIQSLFDVKSEVLANFPGIESYCDYLEHDAFRPLMDPAFGLIWELISCKNLKEVADCWDWSLAVLQVTQSEHPEISVHDISRRLEEQSGTSKKNIGRSQDKSYLYIAIFGLQNWGDQSDERTEGGSKPRETDSLYETSLNIYSLRYFGHVTIQWVDTISEHLRFNPANRRLSLFRFPTFCALLATHGDNVCSAIRSISEQLDPLFPEDKDQCCVSLEQEIILSYRLLFGQDNKSRKVAREEICRLKNSHAKQNVDDMLSDLCERKYKYGSLWWKTYDKTLQSYPSEIWPITCRTMEGYLQQSDVYSARDDFPRLGPRLIKLQQFSLRQRPSKLTDLWRDRRNPLQWYTFWAVLLVGGLANMLAALQLLVAVIALKY
ncbi:hypothetical protein N7499_008654 [Penicillium canescens]|nr:hypothetical protein N7499_008654 [Penicillium canescens]KAJ6158983.1 hypothetical protein N7485_011809 [Penicillium canescens]